MAIIKIAKPHWRPDLHRRVWKSCHCGDHAHVRWRVLLGFWGWPPTSNSGLVVCDDGFPPIVAPWSGSGGFSALEIASASVKNLLFCERGRAGWRWHLSLRSWTIWSTRCLGWPLDLWEWAEQTGESMGGSLLMVQVTPP